MAVIFSQNSQQVEEVSLEKAEIVKFNTASSPEIDWNISLSEKFTVEDNYSGDIYSEDIEVRRDYITVEYHPKNLSGLGLQAKLGWSIKTASINGSEGDTTPKRVLLLNTNLVTPEIVRDTVVAWEYVGSSQTMIHGSSSGLAGFYPSNGSRKWYRPAIGFLKTTRLNSSIFIEKDGMIKEIYPSNGSAKQTVTDLKYPTSIESEFDIRFENHVLYRFENGKGIKVYVNTSGRSTQYFRKYIVGMKNGLIFLSPLNQRALSAFYLSNGTKKWSWKNGNTQEILSSDLYFRKGNVLIAGKDKIYAVDIGTGETVWSFSILNDTIQNANKTSIDMMDLTKKKIYVEVNKKIYILNIETGNLIQKISTSNTQGLDTQGISVNAEKGSVYIGYNQTIFKVNSNTGDIEWATKIDTSIAFFDPMKIKKNRLLIKSSRRIYALNKSNGEGLWRTSKGHQLISFQKNRVYTLKNSTIYALKYSSAS